MRSPIYLTVGMGVGPELSIRAAKELTISRPLVLVGTKEALSPLSVPVYEDGSKTADVSVIYTEDSPGEAAEVAAIRLAAQRCLTGKAAAMVTGPIHKATLRKKGFGFNGHTDFLGSLFNVNPVMAFVGGRVRVALATTHIPLKSVSEQLSVSGVFQVIKTAVSALKIDLGIPRPKIAVCGLNPHAGESGLLGDEEIRIISPACRQMRAHDDSVEIVGPISAETAFFHPDESDFDLIVAMYHDQGLVPIKALDFGRTVNWSMGLPIIRLSVDHGTADDLVGTGRASPSSLYAAIQLADNMAERRQSPS